MSAQVDQFPLKNNEGFIALVIAPTRELALQIYRQAKPFCEVSSLRVVCAYGGGVISEQFHQLRSGCEIVVGTPGRLIDCLTASNEKITNLRRCSFVVLDEADRMFDMGFEPQISMILTNIQPGRQMCMFSATFPPHVQGLAKQHLKKPLQITVGAVGGSASNVQQSVIVLQDSSAKVKNQEKSFFFEIF